MRRRRSATVQGGLQCASPDVTFFNERQVLFVTSVLHFADRDEVEGSRVNDVTLSAGRFRIGKHIAKVGVTSLGVHLCTLHVVRSIQALGQRFF